MKLTPGIDQLNVSRRRSSVLTSELLESLEKTAGCETFAQVALEAVEVCSLAERELVLMIRSDLAQLFDKRRMVDIKSSQSRQGLGSLLRLAALDPHTRRLGQKKHTEEQDQRPGKLHSDRNAVRATVVAVGSGVIDDRGKEQANGDSELVSTNNGASNPLRRSLRLVEGNKSRDHSDTISSKESTSNEERDVCRRRLKDDSECENESGDHQAKSSTEEVTRRSSSQSTEERSRRKEGDDLGFLVSCDAWAAGVWVDVSGREGLEPEWHGKNASNRSGVISCPLISLKIFQKTSRIPHRRGRLQMRRRIQQEWLAKPCQLCLAEVEVREA